MRLFRIGVPLAVLSGLLWFAPLKAQQHTMPGQQVTPPTSATMDVNKMMADMQASDAKLEALATKMKSAQGQAKVLAMQDVVDQLVQNQLEMHRHMMMHMMKGSAPK